MRKILKLILIVVFYSTVKPLVAQNKYALLVAVNDYYEKPNVKSSHSLKGCVNDAVSVRSLLLNRFGFKSADIQTLFNIEATRNKLISELSTILKNCKEGDAVIFYYSGHGVWMKNLGAENDPVKSGMSQAIVMSDLYAEKWGCLIRDAILKKIFNLFVEKHVKLTAIFDCCFSGQLSMQSYREYAPPFTPEPPAKKKSLILDSITYRQKLITPPGCPPGPLYMFEVPDTDGDNIPDCADHEPDTSPAAFPVDSLGIGGYPEQGFLANDPSLDSFKVLTDTVKVTNKDTSARSMVLTGVLTITDREKIARPSETKESGFLAMSAASEQEEGLEIVDEGGQHHGAFTKALLAVYKKNPANLPVEQLLKKVSEQIRKQAYVQTPTYQLDKSRNKGNLTGVAGNLNNIIRANCTGYNNGIVTIDKGSNDGIAKGNILTNVNIPGNVTITVQKVWPDAATATATGKNVAAVRKGHVFQLSDNYTISNPLIKVYIPRSNMSTGSFNSFFARNISPLVNHPNYRAYNSITNNTRTQNIFYDGVNTKKTNAGNLHVFRNAHPFYVFLPLPTPFTDVYTAVLEKDQNIRIVGSPAEANYILYLNYTKPRLGKKGQFVFTFHPPRLKDHNDVDAPTFYSNNVKMTSLSLRGKSQKLLIENIKKQIVVLLRGEANNWLNEYEKR
ncbi:MAG: caspase family protein [Segetibacter sp.]|nr:caspase family protein [Segetibacter sp.]